MCSTRIAIVAASLLASSARAADPAAPASESVRAPATAAGRATAERRQGPAEMASKPLAVQALASREGEAPAENGGLAVPGASLFAVVDPPPRAFQVHDLVTIVVSEQSKAKSSSKNKTEKTYDLSAEVEEFWNFDFSALGEDARLSGNQLPGFALGGKKKLDGKGDFKRDDDFTAKITAEVIEVRPNGNVVLEAYKEIRTDGELQTLRLTGECRPQDIDATNIVQSHRMANAMIEKMTSGALRDATEKGIIAKVLDAVFAF